MPTPRFEELLPGLPRHLRKLIGTIEDRADLPIDAARRTGPDPLPMSCDFGHDRAMILVPDGGPPRGNASVLHELLHLKRYYVDGVPKLVCCDDEREFQNEQEMRMPALFVDIDNQIEHLYLVPHELARYRGARQYWEQKFGEVLRAPGLLDDRALIACEFVHRVLGGGVLSDVAEAQIAERRLGGVLDCFQLAVDESKEAATRCLFEAFAPALLTWTCLDYFDLPHEIPLAGAGGPCQ
ncbi:hypothetical protein VSR82_00030 [Burkholderia sp. JPY481]